MPMTASAMRSASTAAENTANFAQKPNSGGMPASENMKIAIAASVIGAFYYLKIIKTMYFDDPAPAFARPPSVVENGLIAASAVVIALGYPLIPWLDTVTGNAAKALF